MRGMWLQQTCRELQENMTIVNMRGDGITSLEKEMENKDESFMNQKLMFFFVVFQDQHGSFKELVFLAPSKIVSVVGRHRSNGVWR